ncbi:hypothetical protein SAMN04515691_2631 [Leifsonia sp. 98AMF]|jgi:hypothetical protein|uniref:DUF7144 family membrane protein n=1 Tax=Microbacteriaceae TaxID=85023 RepID=UPI00037DBD08|nr:MULTISPECIES: hypothetical protein [Microbacteriaceae]TDQ03097.1 hypothetical protein AXZ95_1378 [Leifsonia sp. 115AMFTsu3.1]SDH23402.1 hypothetical protein SAMN04515690_1385 [Leifsonia sp. 197AMF]SDJ15191.1 hypothetical protein SAMN04515684_2397 [Leifsonia sp. 466MF]SDJ53057.1 hypothetical protein SAMN04515683_0346 [Leifsonia sp. 157MF]SDN36729.1 hypothetical protein SAMN04515686_0581 [Leifsonia sp. 509MF]
MAVRPGSVTFVAVLTYINGILNVIGGVILLITRDQVAGSAGGGVAGITTAAIISILLGIIVIIVARGLLRGSPGARVVVTVVMIVDIVNGVILLFSGQLASGIVQILWSLLIIVLLFTRRANGFFTGR